jgi:hypothetical protein
MDWKRCKNSWPCRYVRKLWNSLFNTFGVPEEIRTEYHTLRIQIRLLTTVISSSVETVVGNVMRCRTKATVSAAWSLKQNASVSSISLILGCYIVQSKVCACGLALKKFRDPPILIKTEEWIKISIRPPLVCLFFSILRDQKALRISAKSNENS